MKRYVTIALVAALAATMLTTTGCLRRERLKYSPSDQVKSVETKTEYLPLDAGAKSISAKITMGAGKLTLEGAQLGTDSLVGHFDFSPARLSPTYIVRLDDDVMNVGVEQGRLDKLPFGPNMRNEWDVQLAEGIPTKLELNMGAGESNLDLSRVDLTEFALNMGAGQTTLDLSGPRAHGFRGEIQAGVGEITLRLPQDVPVRVSGRNDNAGDWFYDGFTADGKTLVNDAWRKVQSGESTATARIELNVQAALGEVRLTLVD